MLYSNEETPVTLPPGRAKLTTIPAPTGSALLANTKGGALSEIDLALPRKRQATVRTDEDTVALVRRLAVHYPDTVIAGILNRQGRKTARGLRFEGNRVSSLRTHWNIPCFVPKTDAAEGELLTIKRAAIALGVATSTIHRLLNDGIIAGEQITPGAPWRIRLTDELKARFNAEPREGFLPMREAIRALGVSRQTVLQRVKRGEIEAVHATRGRQKISGSSGGDIVRPWAR
jgi:predicted DNA-binding transcriptional regulator AlpA